jgi:hypothetical protein
MHVASQKLTNMAGKWLPSGVSFGIPQKSLMEARYHPSGESTFSPV